jgi:NAD(P)-dependent dehydrogenase (short-subunit alcohol dehydrogenase family)
MTRTVAVTGAASGIGQAIARAFAANGDRVFLGDISEERLKATTAGLDGAVGIRVDVGDRASVEAFLRRAENEGDGLDVLVNNAGVVDAFAGIFDTPVDLWSRVLDINLTGCFHGCQVAAELMRPRRKGRIINMCSIAAYRGGLDGLSYTVSKAGILGLTRRVSWDLGRHGITVNAICPGAVNTDIRGNTAEVLGWADRREGQGVLTGMPPGMFDYMVPLAREAEPAEVASVALFLASEGAAYINGEAIAVDGGWLAS